MSLFKQNQSVATLHTTPCHAMPWLWLENSIEKNDGREVAKWHFSFICSCSLSVVYIRSMRLLSWLIQQMRLMTLLFMVNHLIHIGTVRGWHLSIQCCWLYTFYSIWYLSNWLIESIHHTYNHHIHLLINFQSKPNSISTNLLDCYA